MRAKWDGSGKHGGSWGGIEHQEESDSTGDGARRPRVTRDLELERERDDSSERAGDDVRVAFVE